MTYVMYKDKSVKKEWRWYLRAGNGKSIATSGEGYTNRSDCEHAINLVKSSFNAPVIDISTPKKS